MGRIELGALFDFKDTSGDAAKEKRKRILDGED